VNAEILSRLLTAVSLLAAAAILFWFYNRVMLLRNRGRRLGLEGAQPGKPVLLYFTTPDCVPCKTRQRPAVQQLQAVAGERLQVVEIDAAERPDVAGHWGVMSVPTTYLIDQRGAPRHMNIGVAPLDKLLRQFQEVDLQ
jgi:thioredoxin 1